MAQKVLPIPMPLGGVSKVVAREGQPENTCWDALNMVPFDAYGRSRVGQRFGITKAWSLALGSTLVQGLLSVPTISYPTGSSTNGNGNFPPTAIVPIPSTTLSGIVSTWSSGLIPWGNSTAGGRLGNGTATNPTRPNSGPGGATTPGTGGAIGGGGSNNVWTVTAGPSTAGVVNEAYALLTYASSTGSIGIKFDATGTGFISPGSSTILVITTSSGTANTLLAEHGQPGLYGSSTQAQVQYKVSLSPSSTGASLSIVMTQTSGQPGTLGTSTSTIGTGVILANPYNVTAMVFLNSTGSAAPYVMTLL
jgi:hypothetical protein